MPAAYANDWVVWLVSERCVEKKIIETGSLGNGDMDLKGKRIAILATSGFEQALAQRSAA